MGSRAPRAKEAGRTHTHYSANASPDTTDTDVIRRAKAGSAKFGPPVAVASVRDKRQQIPGHASREGEQRRLDHERREGRDTREAEGARRVPISLVRRAERRSNAGRERVRSRAWRTTRLARRDSHGPVDWIGTAALVGLTELAVREDARRPSLLLPTSLDEKINPIRWQCPIKRRRSSQP
jgi:hypothetical protein